MKNALLALTLFAFVGSAAAHEGKGDKKAKKGAAKTECSAAQKSAMGSSCCMKKGAKTAAVTPAAAPAVKSL